jgi:hypothetical protein
MPALLTARLPVALIAAIVIAGCGGSDDEPKTVEWSGVTIEEPTSADTFVTDAPDIRLKGRSFVPPGSYCDAIVGTIGPDYGVVVSNAANGFSYRADTKLNCLLQVNLIWEMRYSSVPLVYGANQITVTASVTNGRTGSDVITVTRVADVTPPFVKSVEPPAGAVAVSPDISTARIAFSERVTFGTGDVTVRVAQSGEIVATHAAQSVGTTDAYLFLPRLKAGTTYELRAENAKDLGGNPLAGGTFLATFSTAP